MLEKNGNDQLPVRGRGSLPLEAHFPTLYFLYENCSEEIRFLVLAAGPWGCPEHRQGRGVVSEALRLAKEREGHRQKPSSALGCLISSFRYLCSLFVTPPLKTQLT